MIMPVTSYLLYLFVFPALLYYCYCRCSAIAYRWRGSLVYTALSLGASILESAANLPGIAVLFLKILLLLLYGSLTLRVDLASSAGASSLAIAVWYLTNGAAQSAGYWAIGNLPPEHAVVLKYMDVARISFSILLYAATFTLIFRFFSGCIKDMGNFAPILLAIPLLFISLTEQTVSEAIYGDTVVWDTDSGLISPRPDNADLILLHLFAYVCMWSTLFAFQRLAGSIQNERTIKLLEMQTQAQERYLREAKAREEQTRSFRHDIKNHLVVLSELMSHGELGRAQTYLSSLDGVSDALSYPVSTKNVVADVLLGSKLSIARQCDISTECEMEIPTDSAVEDIDWCIILANAVDNAIEAANQIEAAERRICIYGRRKGNMYLLHIENSCKEDAGPPRLGVGLSNIQTVAEKYGGTMDIVTEKGICKLDILLVISRNSSQRKEGHFTPK